KLGDYGLLDAQDKAVLDEGKTVTRLQLAFYTEKAKARIAPPQLGRPTPTPQDLPPQIMPRLIPTPVPTLPPVNVTPGIRNEIEQLLKELKTEAAPLLGRLKAQEEQENAREKELAALWKTPDEINANFRK